MVEMEKWKRGHEFQLTIQLEKFTHEKLRIGYIYSAYDTGSQIFLAFSSLYLFNIILVVLC